MIASTWRYPADAYRWLLSTIAAKGNLVRTEDGALCREVCNLGVTIQEPLVGWPVAGSGWDLPALDRYAVQLLSGENPSGFAYTYGERLFAYGGLGEHKTNQIWHIIRKLKAEPTTRRAVAPTWLPRHDHTAPEVPCLQIVDFLIRSGRLSLTAFFRSWDVGRASVPNIYGLGKLQSHVADAVGVPTGSLTIIAASAHIYED